MSSLTTMGTMLTELSDLQAVEYYGRLLDLYAPLLTVTQREVAELFFEDDLSLSEIAERRGISRQGAHDHLHRAAQSLDRAEADLGILRRDNALRARLQDLACRSDNPQLRRELLELAGDLNDWEE